MPVDWRMRGRGEVVHLVGIRGLVAQPLLAGDVLDVRPADQPHPAEVSHRVAAVGDQVGLWASVRKSVRAGEPPLSSGIPRADSLQPALGGTRGGSRFRQPARRSVTIRERRLSALALCPAPTPARCQAPPRSAWLTTTAEPDVAEEGEHEKDDQDDDDQGHGWILSDDLAPAGGEGSGTAGTPSIDNTDRISVPPRGGA